MILTKENYIDGLESQAIDLFKQLSNRSQISLKELIFNNSYNNYIISCYIQNNKLFGMASMCLYKTISGHKGWVEDVVVDTNMRGMGIGNKLISELLEESERLNLTDVLLFTESEKESAISLYKKFGFTKRDSIIMIKKY